MALKLRAVEFAIKKGKEAAANEFDVDLKQIREWCKQKEKLLELKKRGLSTRRKRLKWRWTKSSL